MTTLATKQSLPVPGSPVEVVFTLQQATASFLRVWITDAPDGSKFRKDLDAATDSRIEVFSGSGGPNDTWIFTPDRGGNYVLSAQEYVRGTAHGGSYAGDPDSFQEPGPVGSPSTLSVVVAQRLAQKIGTPANQGELVVYVTGTSIVETTQERHGENTPRVRASNPGPALKAALLSSTVATKLESMAGTATTILGTLSSIVDDWITKFNAHLTQAGIHANNDDQNAIDLSFKTPTTEKSLIASVNECLLKMGRHVRNDDADNAGTGSDDHHAPGAVKVVDWANIPLVDSVQDMAGAIGGIADLRRIYEAHRVTTTAHDAADSANALLGGTALLDVHESFLAALASAAPAVPQTVNSAAITLVHGAGFEEKAL